MRHDFDFWKVPKFLKDNKDYNGVKEFFANNFALLKEVRLGAIAKEFTGSSQMSSDQFYKLINLTNIKDRTTTTGIIDGLFIAVNYEEVDDDFNDD